MDSSYVCDTRSRQHMIAESSSFWPFREWNRVILQRGPIVWLPCHVNRSKSISNSSSDRSCTSKPIHILPANAVRCKPSFKQDSIKSKVEINPDSKPRCAVCDEQCENEILLKQHIMENHITVKCSFPYCSLMLSSKNAYLQHVKEEHTRDNKQVEKVTCKQCNRVMSVNSLNAHTCNYHSGKKYNCTFPGCNHVTNTSSKMRYHIASHSKPFACKYCRKRVATAQHKKVHEKLCKENPKRIFPCEICHKEFTNSSKLKAHFKDTHTEGYYECGICGVRFQRPTSCTRHVTRCNARNVKPN